MPTTYVQRSDTSDLSGGGEYSRQLLEGTATVSDLLIALAASQTKTGHSFTASGVPGTAGVTGNYTVEVDIAIGDSNVMISVAVGRVNSAGTIQTESSFTAEQAAAGAVLTFNLTSVNLGTWAAGDRLRVAVRYRNAHTHTGRDVTVSFNTVESEVIAPWTGATPATVTPAAIAPTVSLPTPARLAAATVTPAAITWGSGTPGYVALDGSSGAFVSTPDDASLDITGDIDLRALVALDDWTPTAGTVLNFVTKWGGGAGTLAYYLALGGDAGDADKLRFQWRLGDDSGSVETYSTVAPTVSNGSHLWVRATLDVDDGVEAIVTFYTSADPIGTDPASVSWSQLGTPVDIGVTTSIFSAAEIVELGSRDAGASGLWPGKFYYAEIRNGIGGTIVASPDFRDDDQITTPNTVFTDTHGRVWTINSPATWTANVAGGLSIPTPTIDLTSSATVTPLAIAPTVSLPTPLVSVPVFVTPAAIAPTVALPLPTAKAASTVAPSAITPTVSLPTPASLAASVVTPNAVAPTVSLPTPDILVIAIVTPAAIAPVVSLPNPTLNAAVVVTPAAIAPTVALPLPSAMGAALSTPAAIAPTVSLPTPTAVIQGYTNLVVVELDDVGAPDTDLNHVLRANARTAAGTGFIRIRLFQNTTEIAGFEFEPTGTFATYTDALAEAEAATITDYADLQIHIDVKYTSTPFTPEIDWVDLQRPAASAATTVNPAAIAPTVSLPTPAVLAASRVTPAAISPTVSLPTPTAQGQARVTPAVIAPTVSLPTPTASSAPTVTPTAVAPTVSLPTPAILSAALVTPAAIAPTVSLPTPTTITGAGTTAAPAAIAPSVSLPTPTVSIPASVTPGAISVTVSLPTPTVSAGATVTPSAIAPAVSLPTPTIIAGAGSVVTPAAIAPTVSLPVPAILGLAVVTPNAVVPTVTLPNPVAGVSAFVTPAAIAPTVSLPTPTILSAVVVSPNAIALVVGLPTPDLSAGQVVSPAPIVITVTFPGPTIALGIIPFWLPSPAGYTSNGAAYVPAGAAYDPISGTDDSPWD